MFCAKCGTDNSTDTRLCCKCGTPLLPIELTHGNSQVPSLQPNLLVKHWRGDYSLAVSYWIVGLLLSTIVTKLSSVAGSADLLRDIGPRFYGFVMLAYYGFIVALTSWQVVGIWRSAGKHRERGGKIFWAGLVKVMLVVTLVHAADNYAGQIPFISEVIKLSVGIDDTTPYEIRLLHDGTELELAGGMSFGTTDAVRKYLDEVQTIKIIHLNSQGGRTSEEYQLYKLIKEKNLITYTSAECVSACSIAFLAGRERYLGENGRLGFHSAAIGETSGVIDHASNDEARRKMIDRGVPNSFIDHALTTSPKEMWYPTKDELLNAKVIDSIVDSRSFGWSGIAQWRDAHKIELMLLSIPTYSALSNYDEQNYARLRDIFVTGIQKGRAQIEIHRDINSIFAGELLPEYLKVAPDTALVRYWRSQLAEMHHLSKISTQYCADYLFPEFAKNAQGFTDLLSEEVLKEKNLATAAVIEGAATNPQRIQWSPEIQADLRGVFMKVVQKYPSAREIWSSPVVYKNDPASLCGVIIALYSAALALPSNNRSGQVLRRLHSE